MDWSSMPTGGLEVYVRQQNGSLMSKARKPTKKTTARKGKSTRKRTVALAVEEPRVSGPRKSLHGARKPGPKRARAPRAVPDNPTAEMFQLMLHWSPWNVMLRQQAVLASMMHKMMGAKD